MRWTLRITSRAASYRRLKLWPGVKGKGAEGMEGYETFGPGMKGEEGWKGGEFATGVEVG
jgi:hypothetical protein